jgi:hypothetical protein
LTVCGLWILVHVPRKVSSKRQLNSKYDPDDNHVLSIERSVYGDPGAGRSYFDHFTEVKRKIGCYQCTTEP